MTAQTAEPTPRPWRVNKYGSIGAGELGNDPIVAHIEPLWGSDADKGDHSANAAFIVRACNAHDDLVAALTHLAASVAEMAGRGTNLPTAVERAIDEAGAALAKVRP